MSYHAHSSIQFKNVVFQSILKSHKLSYYLWLQTWVQLGPHIEKKERKKEKKKTFIINVKKNITCKLKFIKLANTVNHFVNSNNKKLSASTQECLASARIRTEQDLWKQQVVNYFFLRVALTEPRSVTMNRLHPCSHWPIFAIAPVRDTKIRK